MNQRILVVAALALVLAAGSYANAGQVALSYAVTARFADDFSSLPFTWNPGENIDDGAGIYQLDLSIQTTGLGAGERGFANLAFDTNFGAGLTPGADYSPDPSTVDSNGGAPGGIVAKWATNVDAGTPGDYDGILVSIPGGALGAVDPRATLGDPSPEMFGSAFIKFDGSAGLHNLVFENFQFSLADTNGVFLTPQQGQSLTVAFQGAGGGVAPSVADLSHVTTLLNEVVNLQPSDSAPGTPPVNWSALAGPTYTPMFGAPAGAPGANLAASWNPATQQFSWNTMGSTRGRYVWTGTASNDTGSDGFSLTVDVTKVPEPATLSLLGLTLVGCLGLIRRR